MKKTLLEIYALAVCFVTLVCFAITLGVGLYDLIAISYPEFTLSSHAFERYQSDEAFIRNWPKDKPVPSGRELKKLRQEGYRVAILSEQRNGQQGLTKSLIIILINIVVFLPHWHLAKRAREAATSS